jgi:hypothetical protein
MSLEDRVRTLEETEAVRRVLAAVGATCDAPYDGAAFAALFAEDGVMDLMEMGVYTGRAAIQEFIEGMRTKVSFTMHYWDGYAIDVNGGDATATWYGFETPNLNGTAHFGGLTHDATLKKVGDRWWITRLGQNLHFMSPYDKGWVKQRVTDQTA